MNMNNIVLAYHGKVDMLKAIFGSEEDRKKTPPSANEVRSFAKTHNAVIAAGKKK
ncbi:hypothetical protein EVC29_050 [Rhizobium phage RHph_Y52]|nr:hypothetical protein EVC29_050 [Rhizobium phage RHph_Y52]